MFGFRKKAQLPKPTADDDGVTRVFPKELFQGEIGDTLRKAGITPDMPSNILQPQGAGKPAGPHTMGLNYASELDAIFTRAVFEHPKVGPAFTGLTGIQYMSKGNRVPLFMHATTVEALGAAPNEVKQSLIDSGFGLTRYIGEQAGKSDFLIGELTKMLEWDCSDEDRKVGFLNLFMWMDGQTKGLVRNGSGKLVLPENAKPTYNGPAFKMYEALMALAG